jgi:hypothetical protein
MIFLFGGKALNMDWQCWPESFFFSASFCQQKVKQSDSWDIKSQVM